MRIKYVGRATRRIFPGIAEEWSRANKMVVEVSRELVLEVLTNGGFAVASDDPLCAWLGVSPEAAGELALAGVQTREDVEALDDAGLEQLRTALGEHYTVVYGMVRLANRNARARHEEEETSET